jgi:hypothetical protein
MLSRFIVLSVIWFLQISCTWSSAGTDLSNEKEVRNALASKWESTFMETRGTRNKIPENMVTHFIINGDGTYTSGVKDGVLKQSGKWSYDPKMQMLAISVENESGPMRIIKLTNEELISAEYMSSNDVIIDSTFVTYKKL